MNSPIESDIEKEKEKDLIEFQNFSNGEVHDRVYERLSVKKRGVEVAKAATDYLALDSRESMISLLQNTLRGVVDSSSDNRKEILDASVGSGEIVDWFLSRELEKHIGRKEIILNIVESSPKLIDDYKKRVAQYAHVKLGKICNGKLQDYCRAGGKSPIPQNSIDFINCMDSIYQLSDYTSNKSDPRADIANLVKYFYGLLKPGGAIFISYHDTESDFASINSKYYEDRLYDSTTTNKVKKIIQERKKLLCDGEIVRILRDEESKLKSSVKTIARLESHNIATSFYARTLAELAVMGLFGEYLKSDNKKFDYKKLEYLLGKLKEAATTDNAKGTRKQYGLGRADRGREALWKVEYPSTICIIRKDIV
ncbi:2212_t:CDS:2 [Diversispora eburnea]|uniref:2212_t:CDS:1 n=1 Tax=Diversispora eburnea TaxID=1213867 RepID=A0A9N8V4D2_9GLOM|nr:2212_t:CDS:2 [Diversispora eburnea]